MTRLSDLPEWDRQHHLDKIRELPDFGIPPFVAGPPLTQRLARLGNGSVVSSNRLMSCVGVSVGYWACIRARAPATCGTAIEVPDSYV